MLLGTVITPYQVTQQNTSTQVVASSNQSGKTTAISNGTVLYTTGSSNAYYQIIASVTCNTIVAAASTSITIGWTDTSNTTQSMTLGTAAVCTSLGTTSFNDLQKTFRAKANTTVTYSTTIVGSPNYDFSIALYQVSTQ